MTFLLLVGALGAGVASAAGPSGVSATITAPTCGSDATISLTSTRSTTVDFGVRRSTRSTNSQDVYLSGPRSSTVKLTLPTVETLSVRVEGVVIATKSAGPSTKACTSNTPVLPAVSVTGFSAAINALSCGSDATVVLNNGLNKVTWFEVGRQGAGRPDVVVALGAGQISSTTERVDGANQATIVQWNNQTIAARVLSPQAPCVGTTTSTTVKPPSTTTTTAKPPTTNPPTTGPGITCATADKLSGWGCPVRVDNFDGTSLDTSSWAKYDFPTLNPPRSGNNVRVQNGELQLVGTYNRSTNKIMGAAISDHFAQKYGRWEVRMRADQGAGYSDVSLLWPTTENWPSDGEVDIFEIPKTARNTVYSILHNGPRNDQQGKTTFVDATQWHTYAVEWMPDHVSYFIDNNVVFTSTNKSLIPSTATMHLTLQLDARRTSDGCNGWYQCPDSTTPAETLMHVDYAKVWKRP